VLGPVIREGLLLAVGGIAAGLLGALIVGRALSAFVFGVGTSDPVTLAAVALIMLAVAFCATYIPSRRALRVDPVTALRSE
jgi:ABC-type antimicrobial peptide transport system permease subunit